MLIISNLNSERDQHSKTSIHMGSQPEKTRMIDSFMSIRWERLKFKPFLPSQTKKD